ncbi:MAG TPA: universal stress protein [Nitrospira sp.]|nr:universal stress protein [Nitrospira sp.]
MSESGARPRILFATDFSRSAEGAEVYASTLAASWGATLTVMSVLEFPPGLNPEYPVNRLYLGELMKQATRGLVDVKERISARGVAAQTRIATGIPSEEVSAAAGAEGADLIVVGTVGKTGVEHVLLGSTAERIIRTAPCPVLVIRTERSRPEQGSGTRPPVKLGRLLVPVDFSDCSLDALEYAVLVAQRTKASLTLLHVMEPVSYGLDFTFPHPEKRELQREAITSRLDGLVSSLASAQVTADYLLRGGLPNDSILEAARTGSADLIVMGTHGRRGLAHTFYGSVAESVLRQSQCPVLTVRSPKFHPDHHRVLTAPSLSQ